MPENALAIFDRNFLIKSQLVHFETKGNRHWLTRAKKTTRWKPDQIIVGSAAFKGGKIATRFLRALAAAVGVKRIVIALDTAGTRITINGWRRRLKLSAEEVMPQLEPSRPARATSR